MWNEKKEKEGIKHLMEYERMEKDMRNYRKRDCGEATRRERSIEIIMGRRKKGSRNNKKDNEGLRRDGR